MMAVSGIPADCREAPAGGAPVNLADLIAAGKELAAGCEEGGRV
ncbi:MAG TPA: hypothetical protein VKV80_10425 [Streptosporangiaceae bacterium]|nr:hypothetical protein [Streptosporangiaceae bacterium]